MSEAADIINAAIVKTATSPTSVTSDGVSVTNRSVADLIAMKKLQDANDSLDQIAQGGGLIQQIGRMPGTMGSCGGYHDCDV